VEFVQAIEREPFFLIEGAVIERLRRDPEIQLDPQHLNTALLYDPVGRAAMGKIYRGYLDIGKEFDLPMLLLAPTWRASEDRIAASGLPSMREVNREAVMFASALRDEYGKYSRKVYIGGLMGPSGDAYHPADSLPEAEARAYHRPQAQILAETGVDFILAATLPALPEAFGIAEVINETGCPAVISFVARPDGTLLDGAPLHEAVHRLDSDPNRQPCFFMLNCVHPSVFISAVETCAPHESGLTRRIIGLQANASAKSPEELNESSEISADDPESLAEKMLEVHRRFGTRILGGCCGTDERHIRAIASACKT